MSQFSTPPGAYQHPQPQPLGGPPPRPGRPWWVWVLGGCGGCALIGIIGLVAVSLWFGTMAQQQMKGLENLTPQQVQQSLGSDVPPYPKSTIEMTATKTAKIGLGFAGKVGGAKVQQAFRAVGAYVTTDTADQVFNFYDTKLPKLGWKPLRTQNSGRGEQHLFQKGSDSLMVQVQDQNGQTLIMLMRGNLAGLRKGGASPGVD